MGVGIHERVDHFWNTLKSMPTRLIAKTSFKKVKMTQNRGLLKCDPAADAFWWTRSPVLFDILDSLRSADKTSVIGAFGSPLLFLLLRFWGTADAHCWVRVNILTPWNISFRKLFDWKKMPWLTSEVYLSIFLICDRINIAVKAGLVIQEGVACMLMRTR